MLRRFRPLYILSYGVYKEPLTYKLFTLSNRSDVLKNNVKIVAMAMKSVQTQPISFLTLLGRQQEFSTFALKNAYDNSGLMARHW